MLKPDNATTPSNPYDIPGLHMPLDQYMVMIGDAEPRALGPRTDFTPNTVVPSLEDEGLPGALGMVVHDHGHGVTLEFPAYLRADLAKNIAPRTLSSRIRNALGVQAVQQVKLTVWANNTAPTDVVGRR